MVYFTGDSGELKPKLDIAILTGNSLDPTQFFKLVKVILQCSCRNVEFAHEFAIRWRVLFLRKTSVNPAHNFLLDVMQIA